MNRENMIWILVIVVGALLLAGRTMMLPHGMGKAFVEIDERQFIQQDDEWVEIGVSEDAPTDTSGIPETDIISWNEYNMSTLSKYDAQNTAAGGTPPTVGDRIFFSWTHTIGIWLAALFTLFVLSFLIKDNPLYKIAEAVFIGVSAAYWMVVAYWDTLVPNLIGKLMPGVVKAWAMPGLDIDEGAEWIYLVPLILGIMLLWRLAPVGGWISRWPMAFIIGVFCGFRLVAFLQADFLAQIRNSIVPLYAKSPQMAADGTTALLDTAGAPIMAFDPWLSLAHIVLVIGVLACLVYFFFSVEHKGAVGATARLGIWFLMVTFGAAFGYTVMGRIALLAIRIEFLFDDWLWLIDPTDERVTGAVSMLGFF